MWKCNTKAPELPLHEVPRRRDADVGDPLICALEDRLDLVQLIDRGAAAYRRDRITGQLWIVFGYIGSWENCTVVRPVAEIFPDLASMPPWLVPRASTRRNEPEQLAALMARLVVLERARVVAQRHFEDATSRVWQVELLGRKGLAGALKPTFAHTQSSSAKGTRNSTVLGPMNFFGKTRLRWFMRGLTPYLGKPAAFQTYFREKDSGRLWWVKLDVPAAEIDRMQRDPGSYAFEAFPCLRSTGPLDLPKPMPSFPYDDPSLDK